MTDESHALTPEKLASYIDHTILKAETAWPDVQNVIDEAVAHHFASVCVNGHFVEAVAGALADTGVKTCAVVGFPLGACKSSIKGHEAGVLMREGADEIDFVAHLPHLMDNDTPSATNEFRRVVETVRPVKPDAIIKVIIESAFLAQGVDEATFEKRVATACDAAREAGVDFVKTSTGFHGAGGASLEAIAMMKKHGDGLLIKASGGIRTYDDAIKYINAGASRIGCSASVGIVQGAGGAGDGY